MKRFALVFLVAASLAASLATPAIAQVRAPVVFDMEADVIEGVVLTVPDVPVVTKTPRHTHKNLIQVRKSFAPELLASAGKI